jgi:short subunit dehydrogenase-like uncharacterized protein
MNGATFIIVTGAFGFSEGYIAARLLACGEQVLALRSDAPA